MSRSHDEIESDRLELMREHSEVVKDLDDVKARINSARVRAAETGEYVDTELWEKMNESAKLKKQKLGDIQLRLAELKAERGKADRSSDRFERRLLVRALMAAKELVDNRDDQSLEVTFFERMVDLESEFPEWNKGR